MGTMDDCIFCSQDSIPGLNDAFSKFITVYPKFQATEKVDHLRVEEYRHLSEYSIKVRLDYCGFGLFSYNQTRENWGTTMSSSSEVTANLSNHVLYNMVVLRGMVGLICPLSPVFSLRIRSGMCLKLGWIMIIIRIGMRQVPFSRK
ncbi:hypothetical protein GOBAR_DD17811 [Gossypium barbadense]|nr:hypothetical protein GOBAR_DD17811 [Gossypium barbadense]